MRPISIILVAILIIAGVVVAVQTGIIKNLSLMGTNEFSESYTILNPYTYMTGAIKKNYWMGTSFIPDITFTVTNVKLYMTKRGAPTCNVRVGIQQNLIGGGPPANPPSGTDLTYGYFDTATLPTNFYGWVSVNVTPYVLNAGTRYSLCARVWNGWFDEDNNYMLWYGDTSAYYDGGVINRLYYTYDNGTTWNHWGPHINENASGLFYVGGVTGEIIPPVQPISKYNITFTVSTDTGKMPNALILLGNITGRTDTNGVAVLQVPTGTYHLKVMSGGYYGYYQDHEEIMVITGDTEKGITLIRSEVTTYDLSITVLSARDRNSIAGALISIDDITSVTDSYGAANLINLLPGSKIITVTKAGYLDVTTIVQLNSSKSITISMTQVGGIPGFELVIFFSALFVAFLILKRRK